MKKIFLSLLIVLCWAAAAVAGESVLASITAQNTYCTGIRIQQRGTLRISGTFSATVSMQRSEDGGVTWVNTGDSWTAAGVYPFHDYTNRYFRAGVATGAFGSGTVNIELGSGS